MRPRHHRRLAGLLVAMLVIAADPRAATRGDARPIEGTMALPGTPEPRPRLAYLANARLDEGAPAARRAIIVLHGVERDAAAYFEAATRAARRAEAEDETLLVVPRFLGRRAARREGLRDGVLVWRRRDWMSGGESTGTSTADAPRIEAFAAFDALLARLADRERFPELERIVVAGHSAGGQFVQRYAAAGTGEDAPAGAGIALCYVVANPSSFLHLDGRRPAPDGTQAVPAPSVLAACPDYDDWKYGLRNAPPFLERAGGPDAARARYARREVVYLIGERDDRFHRHLDMTCAAKLQGPNRRARAEAFQAHLRAVFGPAITERHVAVPVPGVGHSARRMFGSRAARPYLFEGGSSDSR